MSPEGVTRLAAEPSRAADPPPGHAVERAVIALCRVWMDCQLYTVAHPVVANGLAATVDALNVVLADHGAATLKNVDGELVCGAERLFGRSTPPTSFINALTERDVGCITFERGVDAVELRALCAVLSEDAARLNQNGGVRRRLAEARVPHIQVDQLGTPGHRGDDAACFEGMPLLEELPSMGV